MAIESLVLITTTIQLMFQNRFPWLLHLMKAFVSSSVIRALFVFSLLFTISSLSYADDLILLETVSARGAIPIKSWKTLRDERIIKQDLDYSCGAASLATIINEFYGKEVTEKELLEAMDKGEMQASFNDMQQALPQFGFRATGYAASYEQLLKLKVPVIVYMKYRKNDHFSVLRGINESTVWLSDPSMGNRTYSRSQFLEMWETRIIDQEHAVLKGKILAILPINSKLTYQTDFFTKNPKRQTAQAVKQLTVRHIR